MMIITCLLALICYCAIVEQFHFYNAVPFPLVVVGAVIVTIVGFIGGCFIS